jgi:tRNA-Thr(GGU) m(6)t(6)A37 methyltransferase TsaA
MNYPLEPIAVIKSPFREKFATPRQSGLTPSVTATIAFHPGYGVPETVRGLEDFSHLWLIFLFHQNWQQGWQPTVRPPRLGGNRRVGVYASRSPFRPNPVGLSAVKLLGIGRVKGEVSLRVQGADLIDGTPILDIKPYIPYGDSLPQARGGFADQPPEPSLAVEFSAAATLFLQQRRDREPDLERQIREVLSQDPRPAYRRQSAEQQEYGMRFADYNIRWAVSAQQATVLEIRPEPVVGVDQ